MDGADDEGTRGKSTITPYIEDDLEFKKKCIRDLIFKSELNLGGLFHVGEWILLFTLQTYYRKTRIFLSNIYTKLIS